MNDLNDIFDGIALAENACYEEAYREGVDRSRAEGWAEGFGLGLGKGLQVGTTLGFYQQFAESHLNLLERLARHQVDDSTVSAPEANHSAVTEGTRADLVIAGFPPARREKLAVSLKALLQLIADFDVSDCENESLFQQLDRIESKYKRVKALLALKVASTSQDHVPKDLSF